MKRKAPSVVSTRMPMSSPRFVAYPLFVLPWLLALAGIVWLVILRFPPSGTVSFDVPFDGRSAWIDPFLPAERVTSPGAQEGGWRGQRIMGDPVYGSLRVPGAYDGVDVAIEFRPSRQPLLELGIQRTADPMSYDFTPIWFEPLDDPTWSPATSGDRSGYVWRGTPADHLSAPPSERLLAWHASATMALLDDGAVSVEKTTTVSLRGAHDFWAVPTGGMLAFAFEFQDANRSRGGDAIVIRVSRDGEDVRSDAVGAGGSRDEKMGRIFTKSVKIENAESGVYRIQVIMDDDLFIRSIKTPCVHWVVGPRLVFGDLVGYSTSTPPGIAWSDSRHLVLETFHQEGLQRVTFGSDGATLTKTHEQIRLDRTDVGSAPQTLVAPKGDVRIVGDGWFAFSRAAFFSPEPRHVTAETDLAREGIRAILTPYARPETLGGGWYRAVIRFPLDPSLDRVRLALSAPGIVSRSGAVDIRRVTLTYARPQLSRDEWWRVVRQEIVNAWRRIRS
jgi:hypothetical protein